MYAAIVYVQPIFTPRTRNIYTTCTNVYTTCIHCRGRFIVPAYYGIHAADNRVQPMFYPRTPTVMRGCIYIIRADGRDESDPYAYGMCAATVYAQPMFIPRVHNICPNITLRIVLVHQHLPTYTHCDAWLHLYNSVRTGAMNRPLRLRNVCCYCLCAINVYSTNIWYLSSYTQRLPTCTHCDA